jgi:parallel beta-helix repeat protein
MRRTAAFVVICLLALSGVFVYIQPAKAEYRRNIAINSDGSISPPSAPIQKNDDLYILTADIIGSIGILKSNITLDGNGHTLTGLGTDSVARALSIGSNYYSDPKVVSGASNVTVKNLTIKDCSYGIYLTNAANVCIVNNTISETEKGILVTGDNNVIVQNHITVSGDAIGVVSSNNNSFVENYLSAPNRYAIVLEKSAHLTVFGNQIVNSQVGIVCFNINWQGFSDNVFYCNNFINNTVNVANSQIFAPLPVNGWDNGALGNYWSDYQTKYPNATEVDSSGTGDTPYVIDVENVDLHPLLSPYTTVPPEVSLVSPLCQVYNESSISLIFGVDRSVNWMGYCLDGQQNVTVTGNTTLPELHSGLHNVTVYANDTYGNMGSSETVAFIIPEPFPIVPVATISVAVATAAGVLIYFKKRKH